jgi:hypothetical protein
LQKEADEHASRQYDEYVAKQNENPINNLLLQYFASKYGIKLPSTAAPPAAGPKFPSIAPPSGYQPQSAGRGVGTGTNSLLDMMNATGPSVAPPAPQNLYAQYAQTLKMMQPYGQTPPGPPPMQSNGYASAFPMTYGRG